MEAIALDIHCHLVPVLRERLGAIAGMAWDEGQGVMVVDGAPLQPKALYAPPDLLAWMDANGIGRALVSVPPMVYRQRLDAAAAAAWCAYLNDGLIEVCATRPERLEPMFHLPVEHAGLAARIAAELTDKGYRRFAMASGAGPEVILSDASFQPLWRVLDQAGAFLFLHPADSCDGRLHPYYLLNLVGNPVETAVAASHLIFSRVLERHPALRIGLAHCGGATAMLAGRLERGLLTKRPGVDQAMMPPREAVRRFFVDSIAHDPGAIGLAADVFGPDRIVFGSDWPFPMGLPDPHRQLADLSPELRKRILSANAAAI